MLTTVAGSLFGGLLACGLVALVGAIGQVPPGQYVERLPHQPAVLKALAEDDVSASKVLVVETPALTSSLILLDGLDDDQELASGYAYIATLGVPNRMVVTNFRRVGGRLFDHATYEDRKYVNLGRSLRILWSGLIQNLLLASLAILAFIVLVAQSWTQRPLGRLIMCSLAAGYWLSHMVAWSAPLAPLFERDAWYADPAQFIAETGIIVHVPEQQWNVFSGSVHRGIAHSQTHWRFQINDPEGGSGVAVSRRSETRLGFPVTCMISDREVFGSAVGSVRDWWLTLQVSVYWPGLLFNWLVWTSAIIAAFRVPRGIIRRRRRHRGLCPTCAYPIGVSDRCTECGEPIPQRARRVHSVPTVARE